jgi:uncharacterized protein
MIRYLFPVLLLIPQIYLFQRFRKWRRSVPQFPRGLYAGVLVLFGIFNVELISTMFLRLFSIQYSQWFIWGFVYPFMLWHASTFVVAVAFLFGAIIRFPFRTVWRAMRHLPPTRERAAAIAADPRVVQFNAARRTFLRRGVYGLTAASFGGTAYGMLIGRDDCEVNEQVMYIAGLPKAWDGFTIGLVTDIHSSVNMLKPAMARYVKILNRLKTDIVVVGGDLVNSSPDEIFPLAQAFSKLNARMGAYGVLGNHDFYSRSPETVARVATEAGIRILRDECVTFRRDGTALHLLGIDDVGTGTAAEKKIRDAQSGIRMPGPQILMCHRPYFLEEASKQGIDLMLSGHTHGGQIVFGRIGNTAVTPASLASTYIWGRYVEGNTQMYVSRGIGTVAVPVRINCPPEITRIVLRPA